MPIVLNKSKLICDQVAMQQTNKAGCTREDFKLLLDCQSLRHEQKHKMIF